MSFISSVHDASGTAVTTALPGDVLTIVGTGFTGTMAVNFGSGFAEGIADFTVDSDTQITATVPTTARSGAVRVTGPDGYSDHPFTIRYPGPWINPPPVVGPAATSGWRRRSSNRTWGPPAPTGSTYTSGPDGSAPSTTGGAGAVYDGTLFDGYDTVEGIASQGAGYIDVSDILTQPDFDLAYWMDSTPPGYPFEPWPDGAVGFQLQDPTQTIGTFVDYALLFEIYIGSTSEVDVGNGVQVLRVPVGEYVPRLGYPDGVVSADTIANRWFFPADLAAFDVLVAPADGLVNPSFANYFYGSVAPTDLDAGVVAYVFTNRDYVGGIATPVNRTIASVTPHLRYIPGVYRFLFDSPETAVPPAGTLAAGVQPQNAIFNPRPTAGGL